MMSSLTLAFLVHLSPASAQVVPDNTLPINSQVTGCPICQIDGGNGGLVEVSGKEQLIFRGTVDTTAVNGVSGTLLLDPTDIVIANGSFDSAADGEDRFAGNNSGVTGAILSAPLSEINDGAPTTIYESELEGLSGDTNVILQATNDIRIEDFTDDALDFASGSGEIALTADADSDGVGSVVMEDTLRDTLYTNGRDIGIAGASLTLGNINTSASGDGGAITLRADGDIIARNLNSSSLLFSEDGDAGNGGAIMLSSNSGDITANNLYSSFSSFFGNGNGGAIILSSVSGDITSNNVFSFSFSGNGGRIILSSDSGNITTNGVLRSFSTSFSGDAGNGGAISLSSDSGDITTNDVFSFSYSPEGNAGKGGAISLMARGGDISGTSGNSLLSSFALSDVGTAGRGGNVTIAAQNNITNLEILTLSSAAEAGDVALNGLADLSIANTRILTSRRVEVQVPFSFLGTLTLEVGGQGQSGNVTVTSSGNLTVNDSSIESDTNGRDNAGNVILSSPGLVRFNNSQIISNTSNIGNAGTIDINAGDGITFQGLYSDAGEPQRGGLFAGTTNEGNAGRITLTTPALTLQNGANIGTTTASSSQAGNITLAPDSQVSASTSGSGKGGDLILSAPQAITIAGQGRLAVESRSTGDAGNVLVTTPQFTLTDGVELSAAATSSGNAGEVRINTQQLTLENEAQILASNVSSRSEGIILEGLDSLKVDNNSAISASTQTGEAGSLRINANSNPANSVQVSNNSRLSVEATQGGTAGNLTIKTGQMSVQDEAAVTVSSPSGQAGSLLITANALRLNQGKLTAETGGTNTQEGANINLNLSDLLLMSNESLISAEAFSNADGGNITIDTRYLIVLPPDGANGSDIIAKADKGNGGNITISGQGIFGIQERLAIEGNRSNDIDASSQFGSPGNVTLNIPLDPSRGLTELPSNFVDPTGQIIQGCPAMGENGGSRFVVTGRGGVPPTPDDVLTLDTVLDDLGTLAQETQMQAQEEMEIVENQISNRIIEAQGWVKTADGQVIIVAEFPDATPSGNWNNPANCSDYKQNP
ncbi:MAG: hypothetical protein RIM23_00930 [Coleofasciculus sp. G3-WIS-01]|uniref:beta strand repeat-containing protein n=1 Tax=Coleofasciculus sp. G3-WIS-01 TaxID=3069528 RepID=UPI0032FE7969